MSQSKRHSLVEVVFGTAIAMFTALVTQFIVFPMYGFHAPASDNVQIVLIFTAVSMVRSYWVRRLFNWIGNWRSS
jgi:hypothetical protein